jgi:hypothetical protein
MSGESADLKQVDFQLVRKILPSNLNDLNELSITRREANLRPRKRRRLTSTMIRPPLLLAVFLSFMNVGSACAATNEIDVILWFDTEDYLLPADDDACKRLAEMLTERKIRATFKVVGEKARVLEKRGRRDVIDALKQHDIGYHANFHSVHPTPSEYLADCGWSDGITEFVRREGEGRGTSGAFFRSRRCPAMASRVPRGRRRPWRV